MLFYLLFLLEFCQTKKGMRNIAEIRKDYKLEALSEKDVSKDPIEQFEKWWDNAINSNIEEINAMTLATANEKGKPSARIVLLKGYDQKGFVFFTSYLSHKAKDLEKNPNASLVFFWKELERQVRIDGTVTKVSSAISDAYFSSRPEGSKVGAWASAQSNVIPGREILEKAAAKAAIKFSGKDVPRPPYWGGYIVKPEIIEFWQGRPNRLHDRIQYVRGAGKAWKITRLAP